MAEEEETCHNSKCSCTTPYKLLCKWWLNKIQWCNKWCINLEEKDSKHMVKWIKEETIIISTEIIIKETITKDTKTDHKEDKGKCKESNSNNNNTNKEITINN